MGSGSGKSGSSSSSGGSSSGRSRSRSSSASGGKRSDASNKSNHSGKSNTSVRSNGSGKNKKLLKASERKVSSKMEERLSNESDSEDEKVPEKVEQVKAEKKVAKRDEGKVDDPFTRRKTRPVLSMPKKDKDLVDSKEMTSELLMKLEEERQAKEMTEGAVKEEKENLGDKKRKDRTTDVPDIFDDHNFDIDINIGGQ